MIGFFVKLFIKDSENTRDPAVRSAYGTLCGVAGIVFNLLLFGCKLFAGLISGAISVVSDAFNNFMDAASSVITLIGFRLSEQKADKDHPFGHGRMEYLAGLLVSLLILLVGFELGKSSVEKIVVEQDINNTIREQVFTAVEDAINESVSSTGKRWEDIQPLVKIICSDVTLYVAIGVCVLLMLLLMLLNFYNIPGGLTWIAIPCIIVGGLMTLALALAPSLPSMISGIPAAAVDIIASFTAALLPIHAFVPILGVALLIISIIWRAIRSAVLRKRSAL